MSMFGDNDKDNLYDAMIKFLETHTLAQLIEVLQCVVENKED